MIGVTPTTGQQDIVRRLSPLGRYLKSKLNVQIQFRVATTYGEIPELLRQGHVHAANLTPLLYVELRKSLPIVPLALASSGGTSSYLGYLVVRDGSSYHSIDALRGRRVAWVDASSASGYLYPRALLRQRGFDPAHFFSEEMFARSHDDAIRAVFNNQADVAAVSSNHIDLGGYSRIPEASDLKVVAKTARIPLDCFVVHKKLSQSLARRLRRALFELHNDYETSKALTETWGIGGYVNVDDRLYDTLENEWLRQRGNPI